MDRDATRSILSAGDDDASLAYLFVSGSDPSTHAISHDSEGRNLPDSAEHGWICEGKFALGVREAMPLTIAPEPVLRGLRADGYFIWQDGSNPKGTSQ